MPQVPFNFHLVAHLNFSREKEEIQYLMDLCYDKIKEVGQIENVVIRVYGDLDRIDKQIRDEIERVQ